MQEHKKNSTRIYGKKEKKKKNSTRILTNYFNWVYTHMSHKIPDGYRNKGSSHWLSSSDLCHMHNTDSGWGRRPEEACCNGAGRGQRAAAAEEAQRPAPLPFPAGQNRSLLGLGLQNLAPPEHIHKPTVTKGSVKNKMLFIWGRGRKLSWIQAFRELL